MQLSLAVRVVSPLGSVVLAHPYRLRAIVAARAKTDKLDAALLAQLLRADLIPQAYIPPEPFQQLRDVARGRARLTWAATQAKNQIRALLRTRNIHPSVKTLFSKAGRQWLGDLDLGPAGNVARDELLRRLDHFVREIQTMDAELERQAGAFPHIARPRIEGNADWRNLLPWVRPLRESVLHRWAVRSAVRQGQGQGAPGAALPTDLESGVG